MYNHAPEEYQCPICVAAAGTENDETWIKQEDIFYKDELVMALINSKFFVSNPGHAIVISVKHYENLYDMPEEVGHRIFDISKRVALAIKDTRKCDGITIRQNNEPASEQHAFHYHMHIIPRFDGDEFETNNETFVATPEERIPFSTALKNYLLKEEHD